jgi:hypothetical protein
MLRMNATFNLNFLTGFSRELLRIEKIFFINEMKGIAELVIYINYIRAANIDFGTDFEVK